MVWKLLKAELLEAQLHYYTRWDETQLFISFYINFYSNKIIF